MLCGTDIPWGYVVPIFTGIRFRDWRKWRGKARRRKIPQQSEDDFSPDGQARTGRLARTAAIADLCRQKSEKHIFFIRKMQTAAGLHFLSLGIFVTSSALPVPPENVFSHFRREFCGHPQELLLAQ